MQRAAEKAVPLPADLAANHAAIQTLPNAERSAVKAAVKKHRETASLVPEPTPPHPGHATAGDSTGIELTRTVLGHSDIGTSEIYAERDLAAAERVMREVG